MVGGRASLAAAPRSTLDREVAWRAEAPLRA